MQKSCNINQHLKYVSHFKLTTATFTWFNTEVIQKLILLYIAKLLHDLITISLIRETSQRFPEKYTCSV